MISYDEGTRYKQYAVKNSTTKSSNPDMEDKTFVQWVADNVDHNQVTLKGKGAFHEMGVISASTFQMIKDIPVQSLTDKRKASEFEVGFLEYPTAIGQVSCRISHKNAVLRENIKFPSWLILI